MVQSRHLGDEWFGLGCCGCFPKYSLVRSSWLLSVRRARELRRYSSFASWFTFTFRSINANRVRCGARCSRLLMTFLSFTLVRANVWSLYGYTLCILLYTSFWLVPSVVERCFVVISCLRLASFTAWHEGIDFLLSWSDDC